MYFTKPRILQCMSHLIFFQCISHSTEFSDVCHTTKISLMYVTRPSFLQFMSQSQEFSNVCHRAQNSLMHVTPLSFEPCGYEYRLWGCRQAANKHNTDLSKYQYWMILFQSLHYYFMFNQVIVEHVMENATCFPFSLRSTKFLSSNGIVFNNIAFDI